MISVLFKVMNLDEINKGVHVYKVGKRFEIRTLRHWENK